jgi:glycosyltransferase involved in cell wall biosynthesis
MLAPPWITVPAPAYGGVEEVVRLLCDGLVARGHDVTLFAPFGSRSRARVQTVLDAPHPRDMDLARWEVDHVARAFKAIEAGAAAGRPFDVVHDHCGHVALAMADRLDAPLVHTLHGAFDADARGFYAEHASKATIVAISRSQLDDAPHALVDAPVIFNPLDVTEWDAEYERGDHVLWIGRVAPVKGPHRAIAAARGAGVPLVLAGPVQPGQEAYFAEQVEPHVDGVTVRYVGEVAAADRQELYGRARGLLMPIRWAEPFGMVMVEAMACGTPVVAFAEGSAPELVSDGITGFLVDDEEEMARAIGHLGEIDRATCRHTAEDRFDVAAALEAYLAVYREAVARGRRTPLRLRGTRPPRAPHAPHAPSSASVAGARLGRAPAANR